MSDKMKKGNGNSSAGKAGPSGSHQSNTVAKYLPGKKVNIKNGNKSQST